MKLVNSGKNGGVDASRRIESHRCERFDDLIQHSTDPAVVSDDSGHGGSPTVW